VANDNEVELSSQLLVVPSQVTFNQPLIWNTTSATVMSDMFSGATAFNQDISSWNTANVVYFDGMFSGATSFNQDLSSWITSSGVFFRSMFANAYAFDQDISAWSVGASCNFSYAFLAATSFNQNLNPWEEQLVGKDCSGAAPGVTDMFTRSACPVQVATIPGDFCQVAPSAMPSGSPKKPTQPPARAHTGAFNVRACLAHAVKHCSCNKMTKKGQCLNTLTTACKAKYVAVGGAVKKFNKLAKAAVRHRDCEMDEDSN
jgi:surface protein